MMELPSRGVYLQINWGVSITPAWYGPYPSPEVARRVLEHKRSTYSYGKDIRGWAIYEATYELLEQGQ